MSFCVKHGSNLWNIVLQQSESVMHAYFFFNLSSDSGGIVIFHVNVGENIDFLRVNFSSEC